MQGQMPGHEEEEGQGQGQGQVATAPPVAASPWEDLAWLAVDSSANADYRGYTNDYTNLLHYFEWGMVAAEGYRWFPAGHVATRYTQFGFPHEGGLKLTYDEYVAAKKLLADAVAAARKRQLFARELAWVPGADISTGLTRSEGDALVWMNPAHPAHRLHQKLPIARRTPLYTQRDYSTGKEVLTHFMWWEDALPLVKKAAELLHASECETDWKKLPVRETPRAFPRGLSRCGPGPSGVIN